METKSEFVNQLEEIKELYCGKNIQNQDIIQSHSLEILLSYSSNTELIEFLYSDDIFLKQIVGTMKAEKGMSLKALLFLVNISSNEKISEKLIQIGIFSLIHSMIFEFMKNL